MSIPDRLWRVVKGHWQIANQRLEEAQAEAAAYQELADTLRREPAPSLPAPAPGHAPTLPPPRPLPGGEHDPLEASYALLQVAPGAALPQVEQAYAARMEELRPERYAAGSPERAIVESRRGAVTAAYERLRDLLNPTETRFERLEF